jgi:RHS repeat-associated protein
VVLDQSGNRTQSQDYYAYGLSMPTRSYFGSTKEGFTGKETDLDTNLQYFGARYYMPNIGRWQSIDPLAEKHPDWTPYNYVLANPVMLVDPDGRDWRVGNVTRDQQGYYVYNVTFTAAVLNSSNLSYGQEQLMALAESYKRQAEYVYSGAFAFNQNNPNVKGIVPDGVGNEKRVKVRVNTTANIRVITNKNQLRANEHLIEIVSVNRDNQGAKAITPLVNDRYIGKHIQIMANSDLIRKSFLMQDSYFAHELGHTINLVHPETAEGEVFRAYHRQRLDPQRWPQDTHNFVNTMYGDEASMDHSQDWHINTLQFLVMLNSIQRGSVNYNNIKR